MQQHVVGLGQVLDLWLDVFLVGADFLLCFTEPCVPGNDKLCVTVGDSGLFHCPEQHL